MFYVVPGSGEPIYEQLIRQVKHAISSGTLKTGDQLPTVRDLATRLVINPNTVARAYRELEQMGLLESNTRRGTVVKFEGPSLTSLERRDQLQPMLEQLVSEARLLGVSDADLMDELKESLRKHRSKS